MTQRIVLEEERALGLPVVKRTALGQVFNGAVLKVESRDRLKRADDGTMTPIVKPNGKHAQEFVVTCLVLPGTTAPAGIGDVEEVPDAGEVVRLILKGKAFGDWIDAKKTRAGGVSVGDVVKQTTAVAQIYDAQGNPSGGEVSDQSVIDTARQKGRSVGIYGPITLRAPKADSEWLERAITAYRSLQTPIPAETTPPGDSWGTPPSNATLTSSTGTTTNRLYDDTEPPF